ncbi:hypothetical protein B0H15DRAFT_997974 [Mycena belliarum]|uniref:Uncharacterized protein n=1 Tax=Mycena belliarum TaxID=1033014 RepID=A0AAD6TU81_9AGAR|nr:hypothetical protein B0H15DRAFT_997974 [Mycena belliae]
MDTEFSAYTLPSHPSPCYSQDPACDETRLEFSPATRLRPTGIFTKACGSATIVLFNQDPSSPIPSYGREAPVSGLLILEHDTSRVSEIVVKFQGQLKITTAESGATISIFKNSHSLWSLGSSSSVCPERIDFAYQFPTTFRHQDHEYPLPPSYIARFTGSPVLSAECTYTVTISISKAHRLGIWSQTKIVHIPVKYRPLSSPPSGISSPPYFLAQAVKTMPDEWHQSSFVLNTRGSTLTPIQCQAFIPSVKVFGVADTIPIHLQISAPVCSLREFILPAGPAPGDVDDGRGPVRVSLTRMVTYACRGREIWRTRQIGEGRFRPLPPAVNFDCDCRPECVPSDACVQSLDWDGEVRCGPGVAVGGFRAAGLTVKDFIIIHLVPPNSSPLLPVQHALPVRFVTDSFVLAT